MASIENSYTFSSYTPKPTLLGPYGISIDRTRKFAYVVNQTSPYGISIYSIDQTNGALIPAGSATTGSGPQKIACHPLVNFVYISNGGDSTLQWYSINIATGALTSLGTIATTNAPTRIAIHPTGNFLYVVNRSAPNAQAFAINQTTGALTAINTATAGSSVWEIACEPSGKFAYSTGFSAGTVQVYTINAGTGALTATTTVAAGTTPYGIVCDPTAKFAFVTDQTGNTAGYFQLADDVTGPQIANLVADLTKIKDQLVRVELAAWEIQIIPMVKRPVIFGEKFYREIIG